VEPRRRLPCGRSGGGEAVGARRRSGLVPPEPPQGRDADGLQYSSAVIFVHAGGFYFFFTLLELCSGLYQHVP